MTSQTKKFMMGLLGSLMHPTIEKQLKVVQVSSTPKKSTIYVNTIFNGRIARVNIESIACERYQVYLDYASGKSSESMSIYLCKPEEDITHDPEFTLKIQEIIYHLTRR